MRVLDEAVAYGLRLKAPPSREIQEVFLKKVDFDLEDEFRQLILSSDGAEGFLADEVYLQIWTLENIIALNPYYDDIEVCRKLFFFGSDGSNEGYAFNKLRGYVVSIDFLDIGNVDPMLRAPSFMTFLQRLHAPC